MRSETVWSFNTKHFLVTLEVALEDMDPSESFEFEDDIDAVRNGEVEWFQAAVKVYAIGPDKTHSLIGADYLGGCAYKSFDDFRTGHFRASDDSRNTLAAKSRGVVYCHYFPDMVRSAIQNARENLAPLQSIRIRAA